MRIGGLHPLTNLPSQLNNNNYKATSLKWSELTIVTTSPVFVTSVLSRVAVSGGSKSVGILSTAGKMMRALTLLLALVLPSLQQSHKGVRQVVRL